jgi:hypothetical protein
LEARANVGRQFERRSGLLPTLGSAGPEQVFHLFVIIRHRHIGLDGKTGGFPVGKHFGHNFLKLPEAFTQARTDGFGIKIQFRPNIIIAQIGKIAQFNNLATWKAQFIEGAGHLGVAFGLE